MRRPPLVVAVFVAVIAVLSGGAAAYAVMDKPVHLDVDGQSLVVHTFATDVAGVLRKARVAVGPHDAVAPDLNAPVHNGSSVIVRHGRLVNLTVDGQPRHVWVTALSVNDALGELGLPADGAWTSVSRSKTIPRRGLSLAVRIPQHVTVLVDGRRLSAVTVAPSVRDLLTNMHVTVRPLDHVSVPATLYPTDGLVVSVTRIDQRFATDNVGIPFRTVKIPTSTLYVGDSRVKRYGEPGLRVNTYRVVWRNKKLVGRTLVLSQLRTRPVPEILDVGTKPQPSHKASADGLNWPALAHCESGGNPRAVSPDGQYRGLYQFTFSTWRSVGGSGDPIDAAPSEQTYRAQLLYRRDGDQPWPVCGHYLYS